MTKSQFRNQNSKIKTQNGFTLVELILVIGVFSLTFGMGSIALGNLVANQALRLGGERVVQSLHEARSFAVAQYRDSDWGIYLNTASDPEQYILFKGGSFVGRDSSFDQENVFHRSVSITNISLNGGGQEIVFDKRSGRTSDYGSFRLISEGDQIDISVNAFGISNPSF